MDETEHSVPAGEIVIDRRSLLTWIATASLIYGCLSGLTIWLLPFGFFTQYSIIIHSLIGILTIVPVGWAIHLHWYRRAPALMAAARPIAYLASALTALALVTGAVMFVQAFFGVWVTPVVRMVHLVAGVLLGGAIILHLVPIFLRYGNTPATARRPARRRFAVIGLSGIIAAFGCTWILTVQHDQPPSYQAFPGDYDWRYGEDRPFWPSRIRLSELPWETTLIESLSGDLNNDQVTAISRSLAAWANIGQGPLDVIRGSMAEFELGDDQLVRVNALLDEAGSEIRNSGAIVPDALTGSAGCGASGCHAAIYKEWLPSAHGFSAIDSLFLGVQELLADSRGAAETRACAGCHDPVALLAGARDGSDIAGDLLVHYEGNSCLVCHSTISTDVEGNGGYVLQIPERYLFAGSHSWSGTALNQFLIRSYPQHHVSSFKRPLYKSSEFCAACHKQTSTPGVDTAAGFAQEQNEYDSWRRSRWYHADDESQRVECRECHMPLVDSEDPGSGDNADAYRQPDDGKHRSHRMLASNMYIPAVQDIPGGDEQAELTIAWLRGEIEVPEIADKWTTGPVVEIEILAPDEIAPGELINLKLHLFNNKTGHDFPAGPLDILESWVELTVEDNLGNVLMQLGDEAAVSPSLDAPVVYKADWYDRQGLPVERHNLWEVVGASYKRTLASGADDIIDVPFRCPGIARPRLSDSASEDGPGERNTDVVFSVVSEELTELRITARLMFRKANPEFLARAYELHEAIEAPVIELNRATHTMKIVRK